MEINQKRYYCAPTSSFIFNASLNFAINNLDDPTILILKMKEWKIKSTKSYII